MKGVIMQVMHRLIRLLVKVFADVFAFIPDTAFMTAAFVCLVSIQPIQTLAADCYGCARSAVLMNCTAFDPANCYRTMSDETGNPTAEGLEAFCSNMFCKLAEQCSACSNCFHFQKLQTEMLDWQSQNSDIMNIGSGWSFPEYAFKVDFVSGLPPEEVHPVNGRPVVSRLTVEMYFLGEEEELVHHWTSLGTLSTDRLSQTTGSGLDRQLSKLIRNGTPYNVLAWSFEKKPDQCRVEPEKEEVREGEEIDIVLSDFRDALQQPSREFNRILVHAYEGKILNGERCAAGPDYRVFRLDEQPITVRYRAPKNGDANSDKVTVYNSCEILPLEKSPLRVTSPHKEIATCDLRLKHHAWKGSLHLEVTRRFQCNAEEQTSELSRCEVRANDEITQKVNLTISMDDFDLALQPAIPATHLIVDASGEMYYLFNEDHFTADRAVKTWCFSKKWISPGSWNTRHETWSGQADRQIKKENINLLITKDIELNKEAMQDLQKQMQEAAKNNDMAAIQELKGQMVGMVQGNQDNNTIPIRIRIEIVFDITEKDILKKTWEYKGDDVCLETDDKNESGTNTIELPMAFPMAIEMKGTYTRGKDGRDIITANINKTETSQSDFYKEICPDVITTINGQINLERQRK
jgi:hypothetical protein